MRLFFFAVDSSSTVARLPRQALGEAISKGFVATASRDSSASFHPGNSCEPVIRRAPSLNVR